MYEFVLKQAMERGDRAAMIPIGRLKNIKEDIEDLRARYDLNGYQRYIVDKIYQFDLPKTCFKIQSIIIVASPSPAMTYVNFHWQGKKIPLVIPATYTDFMTTPGKVGQYLNEALKGKGYQVEYAPRLPKKLLAVRSGLAVYGRNNICYVEGIGSFLNISTFYTDIPCTRDTWHDVRRMETCENCMACRDNCPTGAVAGERFIIDTERCLTFFNESGSENDFPGWIDPSMHNSIIGCMRCQDICPENRKYLGNTIESEDFEENETLILLEGSPFEQFPEKLKHKIRRLGMNEYLNALPRNLKVLLDGACPM
jgi:epoxyqueuosine reductase